MIAYCFTQCSNGSSLGSLLFPRQDNHVQRCIHNHILCNCQTISGPAYKGTPLFFTENFQRPAGHRWIKPAVHRANWDATIRTALLRKNSVTGKWGTSSRYNYPIHLIFTYLIDWLIDFLIKMSDMQLNEKKTKRKKTKQKKQNKKKLKKQNKMHFKFFEVFKSKFFFKF